MRSNRKPPDHLRQQISLSSDGLVYRPIHQALTLPLALTLALTLTLDTFIKVSSSRRNYTTTSVPCSAHTLHAVLPCDSHILHILHTHII